MEKCFGSDGVAYEVIEGYETKIREAYTDIKRRGWGFTTTGKGFGDPASKLNVVGPYDGVLVQGFGVDKNPLVAYQKAIAKAEGIKDIKFK